MKKIIVFLLFTFIFQIVFAQDGYKCYPTNWWTGMHWNKVQVMVHSHGIGKTNNVFAINYLGVKLLKVNKVENENYVFLDLLIAPVAKPGIVKIKVNRNNQPFEINYQLKERRKGRGKDFAQGFTVKDLLYLILPDRFSNGDPTNDRIPGMRDQTLRRDTVYNRHGGDLLGIQNHLDYLIDLGVTAIWLNPVIENDRTERTEHGYAFTDHYKIDRRLGGAIAYKNLIDAAHAKGLKIIQDAVYNHVDELHVSVTDKPMNDWLHNWPVYTNTTYKDQVVFDPYASNIDRKKLLDGWFEKQMPDLNQNNPFVANYLIQHALWTVEEFGIDGWRIDTYAYNDLSFMNRCNNALTTEYPQISIFGETWFHGVPNQCYFVENNLKIPIKSNLKGATDFQTLWGIQEAMTHDFGWTDGVNKLYTTLAQDFLYKDPTNNVIFLDNHDLSRFYSIIGEDLNKYQSALCWLFTCRGVPQLYYASELATTGITSPNDGYVRQDFPGGWPSDTINKFSSAGRTEKDNAIWNHIKTLAQFRKKSTALTTGQMMQFVPKDGVYVYYRYDEKQTIMVAMNTSKTDKTISFKDFEERTKGFGKYKNILNNSTSEINDFTLGTYQTVVLELQK